MVTVVVRLLAFLLLGYAVGRSRWTMASACLVARLSGVMLRSSPP